MSDHGLVGLAQVNGRRGINIFKKINYDLKYVECVSFKLDLKIIIKSFHIIISKENVTNVNEYVLKEVEDLKVSNGEITF
jgi:lipopolysaccharide/colanic/teichoic acid biosynthesis glycosyltransferase